MSWFKPCLKKENLLRRMTSFWATVNFDSFMCSSKLLSKISRQYIIFYAESEARVATRKSWFSWNRVSTIVYFARLLDNYSRVGSNVYTAFQIFHLGLSLSLNGISRICLLIQTDECNWCIHFIWICIKCTIISNY